MSTERLESRLAELEQRVLDLTSRVDELGRGVDAARGRIDLSMREQMRCPACGERSILHVARLRDHNYGTAFAAMGIEVKQKGLTGYRTTGAFELYVCRSCGLCEWYVKQADQIDPAKLDKKNQANIRIIDNHGPDPEGPYR